MAILGVLAGTGTVLFAPWVVGLIYGNGYAPAASTLSVMSVFIVLVYSSIVLGPSISAAGRQWWWCGAQTLCLVVSAALDPILIPWAQRTYGNGSLGVSISIGIAEIAMVALGLLIVPRGVVNRALGRTFSRCLVAAIAAAMVGVLLLEWPILAIPATGFAYVAVLWLQRELDSALLVLAPPWLANILEPLVIRSR